MRLFKMVPILAKLMNFICLWTRVIPRVFSTISGMTSNPVLMDHSCSILRKARRTFLNIKAIEIQALPLKKIFINDAIINQVAPIFKLNYSRNQAGKYFKKVVMKSCIRGLIPSSTKKWINCQLFEYFEVTQQYSLCFCVLLAPKHYTPQMYIRISTQVVQCS